MLTGYPTILVVDDHVILRRTLYDWLMLNIHPCQIIEAGCGEEALTQVSTIPPHLVIMDISLPDMDGIQVTKQIKKLFSDVLVVVLSTHEENVYKEEAARAGADAYVTKREMRNNLIPVLKQLLNLDMRPNR